MPQIYQAANIIDAQLVVDELRAGGMQASIMGQYLSGAIGELPADTLIGVWLDEPRHAARARIMIEEFEQSRRNPGPDSVCSRCGETVGGQFSECWLCGQRMPLPGD